MAESSWFYKKQGKKWIFLFIIAFTNIAFILAILIALEPLWGDINFLLTDIIGLELDYAITLILIVVTPMIYLGILILHNIRKLIKTDKVRPFLLHKIVTIVIIALFDLIIAVLIIIFGEDAVIVSSFFENISIYLYLGLYIMLFIVLYPLLTLIKKKWRSSGSKIKAGLIIAGIIGGYSLGFSLPFIFPAANVISGVLPLKPMVIAHRGASHLAPENTIEAGQVAIDFLVDGWEIDVQVSLDGIPFLMHDDTLKRTTNVSEKFPGRENELASNFMWAELQQLDAGSWFADQDPYRALAKGIITPAQALSYRGAKIPSLEEAVNFTRDNGLILDVDFKGVPSGHPYYSTYFNICLTELLTGGIDEQVWIATGNLNWLQTTQLNAPNMTTALSISTSDPLTVAEFQASGFNMTNINHALSYDVIRAYAAAGIDMNIWTVDNVWRYSQLWCLGVTSVVTNEPHKFVGLLQPNWYFHTDVYILFWIVIYILGLSFVTALKTGAKPTPKD